MRSKISAITKTIAKLTKEKTSSMRAFSAIPGIGKISSLFSKKPSTRNYASQAHCDAHMNQLPIPCGCWGPWYNAQQSLYNTVLLAGIVVFATSYMLMIYTDSFFLNWSPPAQPGEPSDSVEECHEDDS